MNKSEIREESKDDRHYRHYRHYRPSESRSRSRSRSYSHKPRHHHRRHSRSRSTVSRYHKRRDTRRSRFSRRRSRPHYRRDRKSNRRRRHHSRHKYSRSPSRSSSERSSYSSPSSSPSSDHRKKDAREIPHYRYHIDDYIKDYKIVKFLGDGTFGRVLRVRRSGKFYACKVIKAVDRYVESAKVEADILERVMRVDVRGESHCLRQFEHFEFYKHHRRHYAIVFEELGKSLYDILKSNNYRGFSIKLVQSFGLQLFECLRFLHRIGLTHTDLKPENLLLTENNFEKLRNPDQWPPNAYYKDSTEDAPVPNYYLEPKNPSIKIIDFGGATFAQDYHGSVINTRQYRAPEVILQCCEWDEKSDIWSAACILAELYTGDMLFATHDSVEHLGLITKLLGQFPRWMAVSAAKEFKQSFKSVPGPTGSPIWVLDWPRCAPGEDAMQNYNSMKSLNEVILKEDNDFKEFLQFLLKVDPKERPSAEQALNHKFFAAKFEKPEPFKAESTSASANRTEPPKSNIMH